MTPVAGLLLAAGRSTRLGRDKRLLRFRGETLLRGAARRLAAVARPALVVLPAADARLAAELDDLAVEIVENPEPERGLGRSVALGASALAARGVERGTVLLTLVDQPRLECAHLEALIAAAEAGGGWAVCDYGGGEWGTPASLPASALADLARLDGDLGARALFAARGEAVARVPCPEARLDVDRSDDYERLVGESSD